MSDERKYYYLKMKEDFFDLPEMKVIEGLQNGYKYSNILLKMYLHSLKREGKLMVTDYIPYDVNSLASVVGHDVDTVRVAIDMFTNFGLIGRLDSGAIFMTQIQNFIGKSSTEADRKREYRARIEAEKLAGKLGLLQAPPDQPHPALPGFEEVNQPGETPPEQPPEPPKTPNCPYDAIVALYNEKCMQLTKVRELTDKRKKSLLAIWKKHTDIAYFTEVFSRAGESDFLAGDNDRKWKADFDFLINVNNIAKILEGKYDNKAGQPNSPSPRPQNAFDMLRQRREARG